jgi:hypothetical protein
MENKITHWIVLVLALETSTMQSLNFTIVFINGKNWHQWV